MADQNGLLDGMVSRRQAIAMTGAAAAGGIGLAASGSSLAQAESAFQVTSEDVQITTKQGHVDEVYIQPNLRIDWANFTESPGKIFTYIEAKVHGSGEGYMPIFRCTFWASPSTNANGNGEKTSGPGPSGTYRSNTTHWAPQIVLADIYGVPDYASLLSGYSTDVDSYLTAQNTGGAPGDLARDRYAKNFGYYGPAAHASAFDAEKNSTTATKVNLRYTFAFQTLNESMLSYYIENKNEDNATALSNALDQANPRESVTTALESYGGFQSTAPGDLTFWSNIEVREVTRGDAHSELVMNDDYADYTQNGVSLSSNHAPSLQAHASETPAIVTGNKRFKVHVTDAEDQLTTDGSSNTGATGDEA